MKISDYGVGVAVRGQFCKSNEVLFNILTERVLTYNKAYGEEFSEAKIGTLGNLKYNGNIIGSLLLIPVGKDIYTSPTKTTHSDVFKFISRNNKIVIQNLSPQFVTMTFNNFNNHKDTSEYNLNKHGWYKIYVK